MFENSSRMFEASGAAAPTWTHEGPKVMADWRVVDRALREIRTRRSDLDADEARWLREAEAIEIWRPLGMVSILDYLERMLGYAPRTAQDRLRVARALGTLPRLTAALASDELCYSAVRELTRVATPATEASWIEKAAGKNLRQIEEAVACHRPGDRPDDPPDPTARTHVARFELAAETYALLRQVRSALDDEHGTNLSDDGFIAALCSSAFDVPSNEPSQDREGRARFQIAVTICERCRQGWQQGAGANLPIGPAAVERALCDAQHIGSIDGSEPERAHQDIPPSVARFVRRRDGGRCRVDGCRSARGLELHHIVHREHGGSHDATNIILTCSACHHAHHAGTLEISGTADRLTVVRPEMRGAGARDLVRHAAAGDTAQPSDSLPARSGGAHVDAASAPTASDQTAGGGGREGAADASTAWAEGSRASSNLDLAASAPAVTEPTARGGVRESAADASTAWAEGSRASSNLDLAASAPAVIEPTAGGGGRESVTGSGTAWAEGTRISSNLGLAVLRTETKLALTGLGWAPAVANSAISAALAALGPGVSLEQLIYESLRRCPVPRA